jgi:hypothetical protein
MEAGKEEEHDLRGKKIWARRPLSVHLYGGASVLTRSRGVVEEASEKTTASCLLADQREARV